MLNLYRELLQAPGLKDWLLETREKKLHAHERADTDIKATQAHYTILDVLQSLYGFLWVRWLQSIERRPGYLLLDLPTQSLPVWVEVALRERAWKVRRKDRG